MNRIRDLVACGHARLRAVDYDESYHWLAACVECGATLSMTQREWAAWMKAHAPAQARPAALVVGDEPASSGRAPRV